MTDPPELTEEDLAALELRQVIDDDCGWETEEQSEEANYAARLRDVAKRWKAAEDAIDAERSLAEQATQARLKAERELATVKAERGYDSAKKPSTP